MIGLMTTSQKRKDKRTIIMMREIARKYGYTIAVHGSQGKKDLDLIACPWVEEAISAEQLIDNLIKEIPKLYLSIPATHGKPKPFGRKSWILVKFPFPGRIIDISIMPK